MFFRMEVKLNTQAPANVMKTWQSSSESTYAINETRDVPWSDLGELRIGTYKPGTEDEHASVILLAYVITSDSIYMKLSASGPTGTGASMAAILQNSRRGASRRRAGRPAVNSINYRGAVRSDWAGGFNGVGTAVGVAIGVVLARRDNP